jgi:hypothetical protein
MPQSGVAVLRGERSHDDERMAAPRVDPGPVARPESPPRDVSTTGVPGRRTVTIRGHGAERYVPPSSRSSRRRPERRYERPGFRPDRAAMWAVFLGLMLILAAATSAHAATLHALSHLH